MLLLKIILIAVGSAFLIFGYLIYFRGKYSLINGFEAELRAGRKTERYAKRIGIAELIIGIIMILSGIVLFILF